jgi:hypothetical protein
MCVYVVVCIYIYICIFLLYISPLLLLVSSLSVGGIDSLCYGLSVSIVPWKSRCGRCSSILCVLLLLVHSFTLCFSCTTQLVLQRLQSFSLCSSLQRHISFLLEPNFLLSSFLTTPPPPPVYVLLLMCCFYKILHFLRCCS